MNDENSLKIHWVVEGIAGSRNDGYHSPLASNRYRAIVPAQALRELGHDVQFIAAEQWRWRPEASADVVVVGKLLPSGDGSRFHKVSSGLLEQLRVAASSAVIVADFNDDHFDRPLVGDYWCALAAMAHVCVAGSDAMADVVRRYARGPVVVVGDPLGSPKGLVRVFEKASTLSRLARSLMPGASTDQRLKFAWYGNPVNWAAMQRWAEQLAAYAAERPWVAWVTTQPLPSIQAAIDEFNSRFGPKALMELVPWEEETQWAVVADADVVLVPSEPNDPKKAVKTGNRLTDALHAGRYVIASPLPSYKPYEAFAALTEDPLAAVKAYVEDPAAAREKVERGQVVVESHCNAVAVAHEWQRAFRLRSTRGSHIDRSLIGPAALSPPVSAVKLNLGCGDKILPGYVNVDVVESRAGKRPDVIADLRDLRCFEDNYADEVMAIHVVEHFWRWEVEAVLREWVRVLKPGGRMVLECPNLQSACEAFLADPDQKSRHDKAGQTTMWVFYGDPQWKDPLMVHRWGYTPRSLGQLMESVGLVNARQEPAQYKLREPRDMRVVADKL